MIGKNKHAVVRLVKERIRSSLLPRSADILDNMSVVCCLVERCPFAG